MPVAASLYYSLSPRGIENKPSLVLIHGAGGSHLSWPADMRRLAGWNVLAVDLPGHGRSAGLGQQSIPRYAGLLVDFLAEIGIHQAVLAGHSMGGAIAIQAALDQPTMVAGLALVSTGAYLGIPPDLLQDFSDPLTVPQALGKFQRLAFSPDSSPFLVAMSIKLLQEGRGTVLAGDWQACAAFDQRSQVERITCPAWVAVGADDRLTPLPYAHFLAARLANASVTVIPHAGHMVILEKPAELVEGLVQFLEANFRNLPQP
jgi:pimeloyl-ACP methyl ester carboxylesterase